MRCVPVHRTDILCVFIKFEPNSTLCVSKGEEVKSVNSWLSANKRSLMIEVSGDVSDDLVVGHLLTLTEVEVMSLAKGEGHIL